MGVGRKRTGNPRWSAQLISGLVAWSLVLPALAYQVELPPAISRSYWTATDGLPQNSVSGICQDSQGYLWIGTYGGLARFDGQRFEVFDVANREDLPENRFHQVLPGPGGMLWLRIPYIGMLRYSGDEFTEFGGADIPHNVTIDDEGGIWGAFEHGAGRIHSDRVEWVWDEPVGNIIRARDGAIWIATRDWRLIRIVDGEESVIGPEAGLPGGPTPRLLQSTSGVLWVGGLHGVWRGTDPSNTRFEKIEGLDGPVSAMAQDAHGSVYVACGDGIKRVGPDSGTPVEVASDNSTCLLVDRRGNLWAGSNKGTGLQCIRFGPLQDATAAAGLEVGNTWAITEGRSGAVVILQDHAVVEVLGDRIERRAFHDDVRSVLTDHDGDLWVGGQSRVIRIRGDVETEYGPDSGLLGNVRAFLETRDHTLLVGTTRGVYAREGDRFRDTHPGEVANVRCLLEEEASGVLWVGMLKGLARVDGDSITQLTSKDGLSAGSVRALHLDEDGVLWVATYGGGLSRIDEDGITRFTMENGLVDNSLACILEDDDHRFWINSNSGPFVVRREDLNRVARGEGHKVACVSFTYDEGAREANGGNQSAGWRAPDGRMWLPSIEGVTVADPRKLPVDEAPPKILIESLDISEGRALDVRFTGLGFSSPERVQLQYRLIGNDSDWIDDDGRREARYNYVRPGEYEFRVRGRNGFGPWSQAAGWNFEVPPHFHETKTFFIGIVVLVGLAVFGLAERRIKVARKRNAELVELVRQRERAEQLLSRSEAELSRLTRELLTTHEAERKLLSRELHDDVTQRLAALALQIELAEARMSTAPEKAQERLRDMTEKAQQLAGDVQQLSRRLHPVGLRTLGLTESIRQECEAFTRREGVEVQLAEGVASDEVSEEVAVAAFRILQESFHNIEKHAHAEEVRVSMEMDGDDLVFTVADTGCGFENDGSVDTGLGLITMRERAASIGGKLKIVSHPGEGTTLILRAPGRGTPT